MASVTLYERLEDVMEKVSGIGSVVWGMRPGGTFQLTSKSVRGAVVPVFVNMPAALGDQYRPWLDEHKDKVWLVYEDQRLTFGEVRAQMDAVGAELVTGLGVRPGDKVGICMRNYPEFMISFLAITSVGAVAVPLNALWKSEEVSVEESGANEEHERLAELQFYTRTSMTLALTLTLT